MKKNVIALLLSVVLAAGSIGTVPAWAAETTVQEKTSGENLEEIGREAALASEEDEEAESDQLAEESSESETEKAAEEAEENETDEPVEEVSEAETEQAAEEESEESIPEETEEADAGVTYEESSEEASTREAEEEPAQGSEVSSDESEEDDEQDEAVPAEEDTDDETVSIADTEEIVITEEELLIEAANEAKLAGEVVASGSCGDNATWTLYKSHLFVISGSGEMADYNVINNAAPIPWNSYKDDIYEVVIEDGITSIGNYSFYYFDELLNISIPNSVNRVGKCAFIGCTGLTSVMIPDEVTEIGASAFCECTEITDINIPESIESIGGNAFADMPKWNVDLYLSDNITHLGGGAFYGCTGVRSVRIPHSITEIEGGLFGKCSITEIDIPDNITSIGDKAFAQTLLKEVTIPGSVKTIGENAFDYCQELEKVILSDGVEEIGARCFINCYKLSSLTLSKGLTIIPEGAFACTRNLGVVSIPDGVTTIGYCAFEEGGLSLIEIPESVNYIGALSMSIATRIVYYGSQKHWDKIENYADHGNVYCVTTPVTEIKLEKEEYIVEVGKNININPILCPEDASCPFVFWSVSESDIASCSTSYLYRDCTLYGKKVGTTTLTAESVDGDHTVSSKITVVNHRVTGISMPDEESETSLGIGLSKQLHANVIPENADNQIIAWSSSDPDVVSVDDAGNITGVSSGTATITATTEEGGYQSSCNVTTYVPVSDIVLSEDSIVLARGHSQTIYATISPDNVDQEHKKLIFSPTDKNVVSVRLLNDDNPQRFSITGNKAGQTRVEVSTAEGHVKKYIDVTVVVPVTGITVMPVSKNMHVGEELLLVKTIKPSDATNQTVTWSSSNPEIATVNENGEVTALKLGETTIKAVTEDAGFTASCKISVIIPTTGIKLDKSRITILEKDTDKLNATITPEDAGDKSVVWSSSNRSIATVDQNGKITAVKAGVATIKATSNDGGFTASCTVTVSHAWNENYTVDKEATCTEDGSESIHCSVCNAVNESTVRSIPKKDHNYGAWSVIKEETCTEDGSKERICADCGDKVTEAIPAPGHAWDEEYTIDQEATCTEDGEKSIHCHVCGETKNDEIIPARGHQFGDWETIETSSCEESGSEKHTCSVCGFVETRGVDPLGHTWNEDYTIDQEATCTENGSRSIHCAKCDAIKDSEVIPASGHTYGEWEVIKTANCTEEGSRERVCTVCNEKETEAILPVGHIWNESYTLEKEATCTEKGHESIYCSICGAVDETTSRTIPKKNHAYGSWKVIKRLTCTEDGILEKTCADCGDTVTETIDATGHDWNEQYSIDKKPTYTEEGSKSIHCVTCNAIKEGSEEAIPKLPKPVSLLTISGMTAKTYTGKAQTQAVVVKDGTTTLVKGTDYTLTYKNNINAGTASVTIKGKGNYTGSVTKTFTIKKAANAVTAKNFVKTYSVAAQTFALGATAKGGTLTYASSSSSVTVTKTGKVTIKAKFIGKATITITAQNANYNKATKKITVTVNPTKTGISSVTSTAAGQMVVKWKKNAVGTGYQIQYSTSSKFTGVKIAWITKNTVVSKKITNLTKGKKYYVRMRTYKTVGGVKYYSGWCTVKAVTIRK